MFELPFSENGDTSFSTSFNGALTIAIKPLPASNKAHAGLGAMVGRSGESRRRSCLMGIFVAGSRQGAVRHRPGKRTPLEGRLADRIRPRLKRRDANATGLAESARVVVAIALVRGLTASGGAVAGLQTNFRE